MPAPRQCTGSAKFGIEAHQAPVDDFPIQPSQKDGLGRMCKTHWKVYVSALAKARKDGAGGYPLKEATATVQSEAAARVATKRAARVAAAEAPVDAPSGPETPTVTKRRRKLEVDVEAAGVGTDEGQRILESAKA